MFQTFFLQSLGSFSDTSAGLAALFVALLAIVGVVIAATAIANAIEGRRFRLAAEAIVAEVDGVDVDLTDLELEFAAVTSTCAACAAGICTVPPPFAVRRRPDEVRVAA